MKLSKNKSFNATKSDFDFVSKSLGRETIDIVEVSFRCVCGNPGVIKCPPLLQGKKLNPTTYYLVLPSIIYFVSKLEAAGTMKELNQLLATSIELQEQYLKAHLSYIADREQLGVEPRLAGNSAGGMPTYIKCLHALIAHSLATGGENPIGEMVIDRLVDEFGFDVKRDCRCQDFVKLR